MARFRFKFDTLLKQRKAREEEALRGLGAAQRTYQEERSQKAAVEKQLENALVRRESLGKTAITITAFQLEQDYITGTKQRIIQCGQAITRATRGVEKALRAYLHARRQTRMMESLYEKHFAEYKKERARKEQKELEDLTIMRSQILAESRSDDAADHELIEGHRDAGMKGEVA